jgi:hypothetical protein
MKDYATIMRDVYTREFEGLDQYIKQSVRRGGRRQALFPTLAPSHTQHPAPKGKDKVNKETPQKRRDFALVGGVLCLGFVSNAPQPPKPKAFHKAIDAVAATVLLEQRFCAAFFGFDLPVEEPKKAEEDKAAKKPEDNVNSHVKELKERMGAGGASPKT